MGSRRNARELVVQSLYNFDLNPEIELNCSVDWVNDKLLDESTTIFATLLLNGIIDNLEDIDNKINNCVDKWDVTRLVKVDKAVLRLATYEIIYCDDIPKNVTFNECIDIAKKYSTEEAYKFINGVLDRVAKNG